MNRVIAALFVLVVTSVSAFAQSLPVPSYWKNQRGSEMKIYAIAPDGSFKGVYINRAAGFACQNWPYDVVGRTWGHRMKFLVVWTAPGAPDCHSQTGGAVG